MFNDRFYHGLFRKYVIVFGNLFNNLVIERYDGAGTKAQTIAVPLGYGPKERWLSRLKDDPDLGRVVAVQLPRMSFEMTGFSYDATRALQSHKRNIRINSTTDGNKLKSQPTPVPYNINFTLSIMTKNADDGHQLIEQIIPYFKPDFVINMQLIPEMDENKDISVSLQSVSLLDDYEGDFDMRRTIVWTLEFTMKAYFYGPVKSTSIIKTAIIDLHPVNSTANVAAVLANSSAKMTRITLTPGLLANGAPTSNSAASISIGSINANNNYGFAFDYFDYLDGQER